MILLADVGNSRIKWVSGARGEFQARGRAAHGEESWAELAARLWATHAMGSSVHNRSASMNSRLER